MSDKKTVVITSAVRTAIGSLGGTLKNIPAHKLGSTVISGAIKKSSLKPSDINEVVMGQVLTGGTGQNPARQASMDSGIPKETPSYVVNQVCGSGLRSIASGFHSIISNNSNIVVAGGQESMSQAPHVIHLRNGKKLGDTELIDSMIKDGLWDAFNGYHMGITAKNVAQQFQVTRKDQDKFAFDSQTKALKAQKILADKGVSAGVIDLFRIKRVNVTGLSEILAKYNTLLTVEEQQLEGGFGSAVVEALADRNSFKPVKRLGIRDGFVVVNGDRDTLHDLYGIDTPHIVEAAQTLIGA